MKLPTKLTLDKYGLTPDDYVAMWQAQEGKCGLCGVTLVGHLVNIDHLHIRRWKERSSQERKRYVRSLLHARCNRFLLGPTYYGFSARDFRLAADYLERWAHLSATERPGKASQTA